MQSLQDTLRYVVDFFVRRSPIHPDLHSCQHLSPISIRKEGRVAFDISIKSRNDLLPYFIPVWKYQMQVGVKCSANAYGDEIHWTL